MITIITIIKCLLLANVIATFAPLQWILEALPDNMFKWLLVVLTSCSKCISFWMTWIYTGDIFIASAAYLIMSMITIGWNNITGMFIRRINKNN